MPKRMLSDGVLTSARINALSSEAELMFYRLLVVCDDHGRMDARTDVLRATLFPLRVDSVKTHHVEKWLGELEATGLVQRYLVGGQPYLSFAKWADHQRLRESRGKYPPPDGSPQLAATCGESRPEVKRSEEEEKGSTTFAQVVAKLPATPVPEWSAGLLEIRNALTSLAAPPEFDDPAYWKRIDDWLGANDSGVAYLAELRKFLAWHDALPKSRRKKNMRQAFRNWLAKAEQWSHNRAQRHQFQNRR